MQEAMQVRATKRNILRLIGRTGNTVQVQCILLVRYQWRRHVATVTVYCFTKPGASTSTWSRICRRRLSEIPLAYFTIFRAIQEQMGARLSHDSLRSIGMASVDPAICIAFVQPPRIPKEVVEPPTSCACSERIIRARLCCRPSVFQIEDTDLRIACASDYGAVARVGHEFD